MSAREVGRTTGRANLVSAWNGLALDDDRREFASSLRRHFDERFPVAGMRSGLDAPPGRLDGWDELTEHGYTAVGLPDDQDGIGDLFDATIVAEAAGRTLLTLPLTSTMAAAQVAVAAGLRSPAEGPGSLGTGTGRVADGRVVARDVFALDAVRARHLTLVLDGPDGTTVAVVDTAAPGVGVRAVHTHIDPTRPLSVLDLDGAPTTAHAVVPDAEAVLAPAHVLRAADLTGQAAGALAVAVAHVLGRQQFGRPLAAFQAVKHALADGYVLVERARSLTRAAAISCRHGDDALDPLRTLPLLADAAASEAALRLADVCVQLHGAMGVTFEADPQLYLRRARQTAGSLGGAEALYRRIARRHHEGGKA